MKPLSLSKLPSLLLFLTILGTLGTSGCLTQGKRVVFIPTNDTLVRLGPDVKGHVYYWDGKEWELSTNKVTLPEGWLAGSAEIPKEEAE